MRFLCPKCGMPEDPSGECLGCHYQDPESTVELNLTNPRPDWDGDIGISQIVWAVVILIIATLLGTFFESPGDWMPVLLGLGFAVGLVLALYLALWLIRAVFRTTHWIVRRVWRAERTLAQAEKESRRSAVQPACGQPEAQWRARSTPSGGRGSDARTDHSGQGR